MTNDNRLFIWSLVFVGFTVSVALAYHLGRADGRAERRICPPSPPVSAVQCAAVWFGAKPGDMSAVRQRVCRKGA